MTSLTRSLFDFGFVAIPHSNNNDNNVDSNGDSNDDPIDCHSSDSQSTSTDNSCIVRPNVSRDRTRLAQLRVMRRVAFATPCAQSLTVISSTVADVAFSADGELLSHGTMSGTLCVHRFRPYQPLVPVLSLVIGARVRRLLWDLHNDSNVWVLTAGHRAPLRLFDLARTLGEASATFEIEFANVNDAAQLSADTAAVACSDGFVRVLDRRNRRIVNTALRLRIGSDAPPLALACSGDRNLLAVGDSASTLSLWDMASNIAVAAYGASGCAGDASILLARLDDDRWPERLAFQLSDSSVGVWDVLRQRIAVPAAPTAPTDAPWHVDRVSCAFVRSRAGSGGSVLCCGDRYSNNLMFVDPAALLRAPRVESPPQRRAPRPHPNDAEFFVDELGASHRVSNMTTIAMHSGGGRTAADRSSGAQP
jgi:WD40 repeat protein